MTATPDKKLYELAWNETESGTIDKGAWARAYAEAGGDEHFAQAKYIEYRVAELQSELEAQKTEEDA